MNVLCQDYHHFTDKSEWESAAEPRPREGGGFKFISRMPLRVP